eukprot:m.244864 g.244864  ORF g.244864 m.244864 type:complete len:272 (+) comp14550_c0_seq1:210-1025(+)
MPKSFERKHTQGILNMVPSLALTSLMSLFFPRAAPLFTILRSIVEASSIYAYVALLIDRLGGMDKAVHDLVNLHEEPKKFLATPPFCCCCKPCCPTIRMSRQLLDRCKSFATQACYTIPTLSYIVLWVELEQAQDTNDFYDYIIIVLKCLEVAAVMLAFYGMMILFFASKQLISQYNPGRKMLAIKLVLFVSTVQSIILEFTVGKVDDTGDNDLFASEYKITGWTSLLLCIESVPLAWIMRWSYPPRELEFDALIVSKNDPSYGSIDVTTM